MFDSTGIILNTLMLRKTANQTVGGFSLTPFLENQTAGARKLHKLQDTEFPSTFWELAGHRLARAASREQRIPQEWPPWSPPPTPLPCPAGLSPPASAAPPVPFLAVAKAAQLHSSS